MGFVDDFAIASGFQADKAPGKKCFGFISGQTQISGLQHRISIGGITAISSLLDYSANVEVSGAEMCFPHGYPRIKHPETILIGHLSSRHSGPLSGERKVRATTPES